MYRRGGDTESSLWCHTCLFCPFDAWDDVAYIIETIKDTWDIYSLCMFHFVHQLTYIVRYWIHTQCVKSAVEHVGLDACLMERLCPLAYCDIWVLAIEEVDLLEATAIGFYTVEASHLDDSRSDL